MGAVLLALVALAACDLGTYSGETKQVDTLLALNEDVAVMEMAAILNSVMAAAVGSSPPVGPHPASPDLPPEP